MATGSPATWWEWRGSILKRELKLLHHCQTCSWGAAVGKSSRTNRRLCSVTSCRCYEWAAERWWWVTSFRQRTMGNVSSAPRHRLTVEYWAGVTTLNWLNRSHYRPEKQQHSWTRTDPELQMDVCSTHRLVRWQPAGFSPIFGLKVQQNITVWTNTVVISCTFNSDF